MAKPVIKSKKGVMKEDVQLIVANAKYRDAGLCTATLTNSIKKTLGVSVGDIIEVSFSGRRLALNVSDSYYPRDEKNGYIRLDKGSIDSLGTIVGEEVSVMKPKVSDAEYVDLWLRDGLPMSMPFVVDWKTYFRDKLRGKGIIKGTIIIIPFFGINFEMRVSHVKPEGVVRITASTNITFMSGMQTR